MNELIKVNYDSDRPTVLGRDLHEFLGVETPYHKWFPRMCEYGFTKGIDYEEVTDKIVQNPQGGRPAVDHQLTIDMAKELCMIQRNEKGKQARQYFLQLERDWNSPEKVMARALRIADQKILCLETENARQKQLIGEMKPKADYVDTILRNKGLVTITQIAKDYGMSGRAMNKLLASLDIQYKQSRQWLLYSKYHDCGYTHSETIQITRSDGSPDVTMETKWTQKGRLFLYERLKGEGVLPVIEQETSSLKEGA